MSPTKTTGRKCNIRLIVERLLPANINSEVPTTAGTATGTIQLRSTGCIIPMATEQRSGLAMTAAVAPRGDACRRGRSASTAPSPSSHARVGSRKNAGVPPPTYSAAILKYSETTVSAPTTYSARCGHQRAKVSRMIGNSIETAPRHRVTRCAATVSVPRRARNSPYRARNRYWPKDESREQAFAVSDQIARQQQQNGNQRGDQKEQQ